MHFSARSLARPRRRRVPQGLPLGVHVEDVVQVLALLPKMQGDVGLGPAGEDQRGVHPAHQERVLNLPHFDLAVVLVKPHAVVWQRLTLVT